MNVNLLRSKMALEGHRDKDLAGVLESTPNTAYKKLRGEVTFYPSDIKKIIERYRLTPEETQQIFFT